MNKENQYIMNNLAEALVKSAKVVADNFGKEMSQLGAEYKAKDGDTVRTVIDTHAQKIMKENLMKNYPNAIFNLEEEDTTGNGSFENKLLIFGDPFDGTANAQPKLPLSTQGLIAAVNGEYIAAATLHPFENYMIVGAKGVGVFRTELTKNKNNHYWFGKQEALPMLTEKYDRVKSGKDVLMAYVDAHYTPINFVESRKTQWKQRFVHAMDQEWGGPYKNARMMREMGSNIDACMKLTEGKLHVQLTDTIGGVYDVSPAAVFVPMLGGVMTDHKGNKYQVPKNRKEMETPPQQVAIVSIHPELHEIVLDITQKCYGPSAQVYIPEIENVMDIGEYTGFKSWDNEQKKTFDSMIDFKKKYFS